MREMKIYFTVALFFILTFKCFAASKSHYFYEKDYQKYWCGTHGGVTEYTLPDRTRVDCLTGTYAIEFDFASKWAEAIGQALYYSQVTKKLAGVVLIIENPKKDMKYLKRIQLISEKYNIKIWTISPNDMSSFVKNKKIVKN